MSASGITIATITTNADTAAASYESGVSNNTISNANEHNCSRLSNSEEENSSICNLPSLQELKSSSSYSELLQYNKVPTGNSKATVDLPENESENFASSRSFPNDYIRQGDVENITSSQLSPGLTLLQQNSATSSPPPHSYRHSRAYRHFKNPPQPHMCIRTTTEAGEELFINVLSWTRIVIPQEPSDPIPLYGGMRVPPGSPRSPPIVFAVMANPEVLKDSGRHSKDPEERRAMVELMCDFVEAMNPGVKLTRNAIILKDRDISGELKDVWNAVQAQRDREREEQMLLQRQQHQQHFHNLTNGSSISNSSLPAANNSANVATAISQQMFSKPMNSNSVNETALMAVDGGTPPSSRKYLHEVQILNKASNIDIEKNMDMTRINSNQLSLALSTEHLGNKISIAGEEKCGESSTKHYNDESIFTQDALSNGNNSRESVAIERGTKKDVNNQLNIINCNSDQKRDEPILTNGSIAKSNDIDLSNISKPTDDSVTTNSAISMPALNTPTGTAPSPSPNAQQAPTKKEKLGGFLPNGCIFPRFTKNNKHKDKDKDKEPKTKDKEKNVLLSALKKSKDKKSNAARSIATNSTEKNTSSNSKITATNVNQSNIKPQKNCLQQLECGVQKLDLNSHHHHTHILGSSITNSAANTTTNNTSEKNKKTSSTISNNDVDRVE